jgi:hypothetical protein
MKRLKKLGAALLVVAALGAIFASSALAAAVTEDVKWYTGAAPGAELVGAETIGATAVGAGTFATVVAGTAYKIQWNEIVCMGCEIENFAGSAIARGNLKFKNVAVVEPAGCEVAAEIETARLSVEADWMAAARTEPNYWKFTPAAGAAFKVATVEIFGCALAANLVPKGTFFVESANQTGVQAVEQEVRSSAAINAAAGGTLHVGVETAALSGNMKFKMTGKKAGLAFGTH